MNETIKIIKKVDFGTFDIYYKNRLLFSNAENFSIFEEKVLAFSKFNYLFVYEINDNYIKLKAAIKKDGQFENALIFIDEVRYIVNFKCEIICLGRC